MKHDSIPSFSRKKKIICSREMHGKDVKRRDSTIYSCILFGVDLHYILSKLNWIH